MGKKDKNQQKKEKEEKEEIEDEEENQDPETKDEKEDQERENYKDIEDKKSKKDKKQKSKKQKKNQIEPQEQQDPSDMVEQPYQVSNQAQKDNFSNSKLAINENQQEIKTSNSGKLKIFPQLSQTISQQTSQDYLSSSPLRRKKLKPKGTINESMSKESSSERIIREQSGNEKKIYKYIIRNTHQFRVRWDLFIMGLVF